MKEGYYLGFEIHHQLAEKLFCSCKDKKIRTKVFSSSLTKLFEDQVSSIKTKYYTEKGICDYEIDEKEPRLNIQVLMEALVICKRLKIPLLKESRFQRKRILDGSLFSGFQRTMVIGKSDTYEVRLEQDSCKIRREKDQSITYDLSRQGTGLIQITSKKEKITCNQDLHAFLKKIKLIGEKIKENLVKRDNSSIRQDINVSLPGGKKVEIKGVSSLEKIPLVIEYELKRQRELPNGFQTSSHTRRVSQEKGKITTKKIRNYEGDSRYFSDPEIPNIKLKEYFKKISNIAIFRESELENIKKYTNQNIFLEVKSRGFMQFYKLLYKEKVKSIMNLTLGEISCILKGKIIVKGKSLKAITSRFSTEKECLLFLSKEGLGYNKYEVKYNFRIISYGMYTKLCKRKPGTLYNERVLKDKC